MLRRREDGGNGDKTPLPQALHMSRLSRNFIPAATTVSPKRLAAAMVGPYDKRYGRRFNRGGPDHAALLHTGHTVLAPRLCRTVAVSDLRRGDDCPVHVGIRRRRRNPTSLGL